MTEGEWLSATDVSDLLGHIWEEQIDTTRLPVFVASFADAGRLRPLLLEMEPAFDAYVSWAREGGLHPCAELSQIHEPQFYGTANTWDVRDSVRNLVVRAGIETPWHCVILIPEKLCMANGRREPAGAWSVREHRPAHAGRSPGTFFLGRVSRG